MAILEKRRAVNQLPRFQRYQDTRAGDRSAALRGETPITSAIRQLAGSSGYGPMGDSQGFNPMGGGRGGMGGAGPMGGAGKGTVDKFGNMAGQPKTAVTSALKGSTTAGKTTGTTAANTTSKMPGLTSKTAGTTGKTLTSTGTGAAKTIGAKTPATTGTKTSGSNIGKTLTSALAGAALGAGTKLAIDSLTGSKKVTAGTDKTSNTTKGSSSGTGLKGNASTIGGNLGKSVDKITTGVVDKVGSKIVDTTRGITKDTAKDTSKTSGTGLTSKTSGTGLTSKTNPLGTNIGKKIVDNTGVTSVVKKTGTNVGTPPFVPKSGTGATKTVGPKTPVTKTATKTAPKTGGSGSKTAGPATKGVTAKTAAQIKAENPELTEEQVQAELDRIKAEEESLGVPEDAEQNEDGTYSVTEDGMVTTYDADGNIVGMEAVTDGSFGEDAGDAGDDTGDEDTTTQVLDDGTVVTLDSNGDIVSYTDSDGVEYDADGNEVGDDIIGGGDVGGEGNTTETLDDGTVITYDEDGDIVSYTDTDGVTYDGDGEVIDGSDTLVTGDEETEEETYDGLYSDDEGNLYDADGELVQYADGTYVGDEESTEDEVAYTDEYGNTYDESGELIAEGDHSDYVQYDEDGNSYDWDGNLIEYAEGYDSEDEYSADDEYSSEDEYSSDDEYAYEGDDIEYDVKKGGLIHMQEGGDPTEEELVAEEYEDEEIEPVGEEENEDGTITQYFDDGSSITYDADGEVVEVTEATDESESAFTPRGITVGANGQRYGNPDTAANYRTAGIGEGADQDALQAFLDDIPRTSAVTGGDSNAITTTPLEGWPEGFVSNDDGTATYVDDDGSTVTIDVDSNIVFVTDANGDVVAQDGQPTGGLTQSGQGNIQYFDDGSSIETFDDGSQIVYDADGNVFKAVDAYQTEYDDEGNAIVTDGFGNIVGVYDPQGNVIPLGGGRVTGPTQVTGAGGTGAIGTDTESEIQRKINEQKEGRATKSAIDDLLAGLNTYGGAGAAGAVLGALLSDSDLFGGGGGGHSFDMTGVGAINPRTTDFGIGPANYVGYDEYGTPEQMPELYGQELYQNLNAPGFNEVNPGDYARMDAEASGLDEYLPEEQQVEGMAAGGQPQGGLGQTAPQTYYTFGTPVDPLQNLRNPAPFQPQPQMQSDMPPQAQQNAQQMPPQQVMPQQPMPQGMPPAGAGMKSGGLPAWSNVPVTQGRLNFRQGAAVHGAGDGQSDDIPAMLADGEYVIDAETVAQIGNGSTKAGAQALDKFRENIRRHKRSAPVNKIPPKTKALTSYLKGAR